MQRLLEGAQRLLGLTLTPEQHRAFQLYHQELVAWNERFNLTAITDPEGVQVRHFLDSLSCLLAMRQAQKGQSLIDVGTGAGFPGLPIKIVRPGLRVTLVEATGKKADFLRHMVRLLELRDVTVVHARAEELGRWPRCRHWWSICCLFAIWAGSVSRKKGRMQRPRLPARNPLFSFWEET
jgi:16S rRNA (guanine527-N7)-methyltransferase